MKRNIFYIIVAALFGLTGCTDEAYESDSNSNAKSTVLTISVTDNGFANANGTRAVEDGYKTAFTAGDKIGVFAVRNGEVNQIVSNLCLTATDDGNGGIKWYATDENPLPGIPYATYYAYYPYQETLTGELAPTATTADDFFKNVIAAWQPEADQSTYASYTASDLMVAQGVISDDNISFPMAHKMGLAVIDLPLIKYVSDDSSLNVGGSTYPAKLTLEGKAAYKDTESKNFRYIVNPESSTEMTGKYEGQQFSLNVNMAAGAYKKYIVDGGSEEIFSKNYTLQVGDFICADGTIVPKDEDCPAENATNKAVAIVFYVGQHASDQSNYSGTGIGQTRCHGYATALTDAITSNCKWSNGWGNLGCHLNTQNSDWNGYAWTNKIQSTAGSAWTASNAPTNYYPGYYAKIGYEAKVSAPANSSGWFLPGKGQMYQVWAVRNTIFQSCPYATNLTGWYWTSTERYALKQAYNFNYRCWACYVRSSDGGQYNGRDPNKNSKISAIAKARSVLAF